MKNYLLLILCITGLSAFSQSKISKRAQNNFEKAQVAMQHYDYSSAIVFLNEVLKTDPDYQQPYIQLGDIYRKDKLYKQAIPFYTKAITLSPPPFEGIFFALGECELNSGNYQDALQHLKTFLSMTGIKPDAVAKARKYILDCEFSLSAINKPVTFKPVNIGPAINSANREYFPTVTADGEVLIFTRQVNGNEDFYISRLKDNEWQPATSLSRNINTPQFNEGAQTITPDGLYLFFTGCNRPGGLGRCDIYVSHKEGNDWGKPVNLGEPLNSAYWESQPAVTPDGNTLYFVSNRWPGFGSKDIFISRMDKNRKWGKPVNMGFPINSSNEETGLTVTSDGLYALFSTELATGYGSQDIYIFELPENSRPLPVTYVKGVVKDRETGKFLEANVVVKDLKTNENVFNDYTSAETGHFLTVMPIGSNYAFNVKAEGYIFYSANYELNTYNGKKPLEIEILLDKVKVGADVTLKNIFFDNNKYELLPASLDELTTLIGFLTDNPEVCIEIQGHTDNKGDDKLNEKLSLNRAMAVYNYLIANKIDQKRLTYKGYGKTRPVADNATEEGQQLNRRTSFIITKI